MDTTNTVRKVIRSDLEPLTLPGGGWYAGGIEFVGNSRVTQGWQHAETWALTTLKQVPPKDVVRCRRFPFTRTKMSIEFYMWRITPEAYRTSASSGRVPSSYIVENDTIGKDWGLLLHILGNGDADSTALVAFAINGGELLVHESSAYNGNRIHSPEHVQEISAALEAFEPAEFQRRYDSLDFHGVYGAGYHTPDTPIEILRDSFDDLRAFYAAAARAGDAMMIWMD